MKKTVILLQALFSISLLGDITLTPQDEKNWQIQTALAQEVTHVPLDEYMMSVTTPPKLLYTISLPYEAHVTRLNKANFESVGKGEILAELSASEWIEAQKEVIADSLELMHNENEASRKSKLCKEEIIAQKECLLADSELKRSKTKLSSSKALLKTYGADDEMIKRLTKELSISSTIKLASPLKGVLLQVNIQSGDNISPSSSLFVIKADGENWLESDLPQAVADKLKAAQDVIITINRSEIKSKVLLLSPSLNPINQTRYVRFSLPKEADLLVGLKTKATLNIQKKAFLINKNAIIQDGENSVVFIKDAQTYRTIKVAVIAENRQMCYLEYNPELKKPIAISATSILQNMLQKGE
ncbi:MAG: efflux RND transporter periplasmic adaptor subunit [Sulfurimonas sp.]|jgi:cobalt-zinc-cadmium efflux system membrane fusion protein|uniref:efflux RND transporter periplasmic adaptor subunit n=1 Tax=Sulfurimonas sp. TaxID=2022749 RepID=UPI0035633B3A